MGTGAQTTLGESTPRIVVPALEGDKTPIYPHKATAPSCTDSILLDLASHKGQHVMARTSLPVKEWVENIFHPPTSAKAQKPTLTKWCICLQQRAPCLPVDSP